MYISIDITLDYNKVSIAAIALGISVDDTIHLMSRFHHEFGVHGNYRKALRASLDDVGRALIGIVFFATGGSGVGASSSQALRYGSARNMRT